MGGQPPQEPGLLFQCCHLSNSLHTLSTKTSIKVQVPSKQGHQQLVPSRTVSMKMGKEGKDPGSLDLGEQRNTG